MSYEDPSGRGLTPAGGTRPVGGSRPVTPGQAQESSGLDPQLFDRSTPVIDEQATAECSITAVTEDDGLQYVITKEEAKSIWPLQVRQRVREASEQVHALVVERMRWAKRQADAASWAGLAAEIREVARVQRAHTARKALDADVRAALIALAASCILLAERVDRPEAPARGEARAKTVRWRPISFAVKL